MESRKLLELMSLAEKLKNTTRHSWTSSGRQESVAEHSWRLAFMAFFMKDEFPEVDMEKVILMCLFHDLGEAVTGDIPTFNKTKNDEITENKEIQYFLNTLPKMYKDELAPLFKEMDEQLTLEAKLYKALDKLEVLIQHNESDLSTWIPLEYELNLTHGDKEVAFSDYLKGLRKIIKEDTVKKIEEEKNL
ncbi:HD domain-containing protein [Vagococcus elongatus]|uniref:5'-deoxynucleotidase n=1 Tax=Vagococcus elongatus TaxID=180344 RepID=A0A430B5B7_9ENTE|nr:HD domain-containing protein [Vagococcus elongatus]RSU15515.1 phosphohydrolase [Vagococcus elongatus]